MSSVLDVDVEVQHLWLDSNVMDTDQKDDSSYQEHVMLVQVECIKIGITDKLETVELKITAFGLFSVFVKARLVKQSCTTRLRVLL